MYRVQILVWLAYGGVVLVQGDGAAGYPALSLYDRIAITAAAAAIPRPLIEQLNSGGKLIGPVVENDVQVLTLLEKRDGGTTTRAICEVAYVALRGSPAGNPT